MRSVLGQGEQPAQSLWMWSPAGLLFSQPEAPWPARGDQVSRREDPVVVGFLWNQWPSSTGICRRADPLVILSF